MRGNYKLKKKIKKNKFQKGGIYNLYASDSFPASKENIKKYSHDESIEISKKFVDKENGVMQLLIDNLYQIFISNKSNNIKYKKIKKIVSKNNTLLSYFNDNEITITSWIKGPPLLNVGENYNIENEESYSLCLCTLNIIFDNESIKYSIHQNGVVVSLHAIARFIERYDSKIKDSIIRDELFKLIPYIIISNKYYYLKKENISKTPYISDNGVWLGSTIFSKDISQNYNIPVSFIRTFISKDIMSKDQLIFFNNNIIKDYSLDDKNITVFLKTMNSNNINNYDSFMEVIDYSKFIFMSDDKFIERVSPNKINLNNELDLSQKYKVQFIKPVLPRA